MPGCACAGRVQMGNGHGFANEIPLTRLTFSIPYARNAGAGLNQALWDKSLAVSGLLKGVEWHLHQMAIAGHAE